MAGDEEVEAVAQALLDASRESMFAIPVPLDRVGGPDQYRREAAIAIAALDRVRSRPAGSTEATKVCAYCSRTVPRSAHSLSCSPAGGTEGEDHRYVLWLCDECGDHSECEPGERCEVCTEGTIRKVPVVPLWDDQLRAAITDHLARSRSPQGEDHEAGTVCQIEPYSSRVCSRGTKGCVRDHPEDYVPSPVTGTEPDTAKPNTVPVDDVARWLRAEGLPSVAATFLAGFSVDAEKPESRPERDITDVFRSDEAMRAFGVERPDEAGPDGR